MTNFIKDSSDHHFHKDVIEASNEGPVIVDFWAPWCVPCKQLLPRLEKAVTSFEGKVRLVKINTQENPKSAEQLGVRSIPAIYAFKDGSPIDGLTGTQDTTVLNGFIERLIDE